MTKTDREYAEIHRYVTRHGRKPDPGVTTIISQATDKPQLQWAASGVAARIAVFEDQFIRYIRDPQKRYAALRSAFRREWDAKADKGSRIHQHALDWAQGRAIDAQPDEQPYMDALSMFYNDHEPEWERIEAIVLRGDDPTLAYGGRLDGIGMMHRVCGDRLCACADGPCVWLGDWKTGGMYLEGPRLQLAAYENAEGTPVYDDRGALREIEPLPHTDKRVAIYLKDDGTYRAVDVGGTKDDFRAFLHMRLIYGWRQEVGRWEKGLKKQLEAEETEEQAVA